MHPEFGPTAIISALSLLLPLPWHWRAGNVATLSIIVWLFVSNIIYAVDALVWADNIDIVIPVWCDISKSLGVIPPFQDMLSHHHDRQQRNLSLAPTSRFLLQVFVFAFILNKSRPFVFPKAPCQISDGGNSLRLGCASGYPLFSWHFVSLNFLSSPFL
jgi:hypothetical protein